MIEVKLNNYLRLSLQLVIGMCCYNTNQQTTQQEQPKPVFGSISTIRTCLKYSRQIKNKSVKF